MADQLLQPGNTRERHRYRALMLDPSGRILSTTPISANTDDVAVTMAVALVDGHAVELWDGVRFIEHFPPHDGSA